MARMAEFNVGQGHVYLIREQPELKAEMVHYKVGRSDDLQHRMSNLQCGNPRKLVFWYEVKVNDMTEAERAAKTALGKYKYNLGGGTEWFTVLAQAEVILVMEFEAAVAPFKCNT